jgi:hypothetical protein
VKLLELLHGRGLLVLLIASGGEAALAGSSADDAVRPLEPQQVVPVDVILVHVERRRVPFEVGYRPIVV